MFSFCDPHSKSLDKLIKQQNWNKVLARLNSEGGAEAAKRKDELGNLPLHHACEAVAPLDVIQTLIKVHPGAASTPNAKKRLPLHFACRSVSREVMQALIDANPEAAKKQNKNGSLPIHSACDNKLPADTVQVLIGAYPGGLEVADAQGNLPLHRACTHCQCHDVAHVSLISTLLQAYKPGASVANKAGHLPIHLACWGPQSSVSIAETLLEAYPMGAQKPIAKEGSLPLHVACLYRAPLDVVKAIDGAYPEGKTTADKKGKTPLDITREKDPVDEGVLSWLTEEHHEGNNHDGVGSTSPAGGPNSDTTATLSVGA